MIGIVGDIHLRENLGYSDYIEDGRWNERREVLTAIVNELKDCDKIAIMGDSLNGRNNPSQIIKEFVAFLKRFGRKELFILAGNHEKLADGRSAIDFLKEMRIPNWHVITNEVTIIDDMVFCPYFTRQELGIKTNDEATARLHKMLTMEAKKALFVHHSISGTKVTGNVTTDFFDEIVLDRKILEKTYSFVFGGHIHKPSHEGKTVVTGSIFNNEIGEDGKFIWKWDGEKVDQIALPGRKIYKIEDDLAELKKIPSGSIVKYILTKEISDTDKVELKKTLAASTDAYLLLERYQGKRSKVDMDGFTMDFAPEAMLEVYAKERKVDLKKLQRAYKLIQ